MIPGGIGYEVLKFEDSDLREIGRLPKDVRIVCALPDIPERHGYALPREWYYGSPNVRPVFILICHRYCVRCPPGAPYTFTRLDEFLERYEDLAVREADPLEPCYPNYQHGREAWYRDADGVAREYVWHDKAGWVQK